MTVVSQESRLSCALAEKNSKVRTWKCIDAADIAYHLPKVSPADGKDYEGLKLLSIYAMYLSVLSPVTHLTSK